MYVPVCVCVQCVCVHVCMRVCACVHNVCVQCVYVHVCNVCISLSMCVLYVCECVRALCTCVGERMILHSFSRGVGQMFEGKERRKDLIGELRTTHALQAPEQKEKRRQNEEVLSLQHKREALEHKVGVRV